MSSGRDWLHRPAANHIQPLFATQTKPFILSRLAGGWRRLMSVVSRERSRPMVCSRPMTSTIRAAGRVLKSAPTGTSRRSTFRVAVAYGREGLDRSTP